MSTCNQEIKLRAKTQEEKEKSLPCLWSPLAVIPYGLEERQWDPWSALSSPSVTSQVTWAINSVLWVSVSLYVGREHWTRRSFRFLPELRFGAGGSLRDSGNLDSISQPCTVVGCTEVEEVLEFYTSVSSLWKWKSWIQKKSWVLYWIQCSVT